MPILWGSKNQNEDECSVEIGDIESSSQATNESVASNHGCQHHSGKLRAEVLYQAVQHRGSSHEERHHHDEIGKKGKAAEHQMSVLSKSGFDDLKKENLMV